MTTPAAEGASTKARLRGALISRSLLPIRLCAKRLRLGEFAPCEVGDPSGSGEFTRCKVGHLS